MSGNLNYDHSSGSERSGEVFKGHNVVLDVLQYVEHEGGVELLGVDLLGEVFVVEPDFEDPEVGPGSKSSFELLEIGGLDVDGDHALSIEEVSGDVADAAADFENALTEPGADLIEDPPPVPDGLFNASEGGAHGAVDLATVPRIQHHHPIATAFSLNFVQQRPKYRVMKKIILHSLGLVGIAVLGGCPQSSSTTGSEPCYFAYEDEQMTGTVLCSVAIASSEPCVSVANCLCEAWDSAATPDERETCIEAELEAHHRSPSLEELCGPSFDLSLGDVLRTYAAIQDARLTLAGPCDAMPPFREDIELQ